MTFRATKESPPRVFWKRRSCEKPQVFALACLCVALTSSMAVNAAWNDFLIEWFGPGPGQRVPEVSELAGTPFSATLTVAPGESVGRTNRALLGTNIQWVHRGDTLLDSGDQFDQRKLKLIDLLAPTLVRYPGGSHTDVFDWRNSIGPLKTRKSNISFFSGRPEKVHFGAPELLRLCRQIGAQPVISLNVITQSTAELEPWIDYLADNAPPQVAHWEVGNEPYLEPDEQPTLKMKPAEFANRANAAIRLLRKKVNNASIGVPLRSDKFGDTHATPMQGYNAKVLSTLTEPVDYVALHNAYMPFAYKKVPADRVLYLGSAAAYRVVESDFEATRNDLRKYYRFKQPKIAVTEYNNVFTFGKGDTDEYLISYANAAYIFDLLVSFSEQQDILFANHWSLLDNWFFGVIDREGDTRWAYPVFIAFKEILFGDLVKVTVESPGFDNPAVGMVPAMTDTPWVRAIATVHQNTMQLLVINKNPAASSLLEPDIQGVARLHRVRRLQASSPFEVAVDVQWQPQEPALFGEKLALPPLSITWLSYEVDP